MKKTDKKANEDNLSAELMIAKKRLSLKMMKKIKAPQSWSRQIKN